MNNRARRFTLLIILFCSLLFSLFTVIVQARELGFERLQEGGFQTDNHQQMMAGHRGNPFQYRIFSEWVVEGFIVALKSTSFPYPSATAFLGVRLLQNLLIFIVAAYYYKKLGLTTYGGILGLAILAWSMTQALYGADLQFNTYSDVLFYLLAGLAIAYKRYWWIIPIIVFAAFNRETSGLIPFMLIADQLQTKPTLTVPRRILIFAGIALALYAAIFIGLRIAYGPQEFLVPYGNHIGMELFTYNLTLPATYIEVFGVLSVLPILAILAMRRWPAILTRFFWAIVPIWFVIHLFASVIAESRLLLVPMALVFIPGALLGGIAVYDRTRVISTPGII
jgi:hypothetical protein